MYVHICRSLCGWWWCGICAWKASQDGRLHFHLSPDNIWITDPGCIGGWKNKQTFGLRICIQLEPGKCHGVAKGEGVPIYENLVSIVARVFSGILFFVLLSQLFNLLQSESVVRSRTNRWQIPLKSSSNYSPKLSICPSVSTLYVQEPSETKW